MADLTNKIITVFGGTGFVGRYAVRALADLGARVQVITRRVEAAQVLKTAGTVGQVVITPGNLLDLSSYTKALAGSHAVINLVGILFEAGKQNFSALHAQGAEKLAKASKAAGVERFVHISALGVDKSVTSIYARTKMTGEHAVQAAFPEATILRPGLIFGPEDQFFNRFASMAMVAPFLPLVGGGRSRFQPVYVVDVARAITQALTRTDTKGKIYELAGPRIYSFRELMAYIGQVTNRKLHLVPVPYGIASLMAALTAWLPTPLLTRDQVNLLRFDTINTPGAKQITDLGVSPTALELIVPEYLARYKK